MYFWCFRDSPLEAKHFWHLGQKTLTIWQSSVNWGKNVSVRCFEALWFGLVWFGCEVHIKKGKVGAVSEGGELGELGRGGGAPWHPLRYLHHTRTYNQDTVRKRPPAKDLHHTRTYKLYYNQGTVDALKKAPKDFVGSFRRVQVSFRGLQGTFELGFRSLIWDRYICLPWTWN